MKKIPNHQTELADEFHFLEQHIHSVSRLAFFRARSYANCISRRKKNALQEADRKELEKIIQATLFNYKNPLLILVTLGYPEEGIKN